MPTQQIAVQSHTMQGLDTTQTHMGVSREPGYTQVMQLKDQTNMATTDTQGAVGLDIGTELSNNLVHSDSGTDKPCEDEGDAVVALGNMQEDFRLSHVEADTVIIGETDTNRQTDTQTDAHINVNIVDRRESTPPTIESTDTNCNVGTQINDKRTITRSSGKAVKKDKPTPFKKKDSIAKETLHPNSPTPMSTERCDSSLSNSSLDVCRICQCDSCEIQTDSPLVTPCLCSGSLKYIHQACLQKWIKSSDKMSCELCQFEYQMTKKTKPFREWERLEMTVAERRKVVCSVTFHVIAITCVVWSLYVLIDRTTEEVEAGSLLWPFWTKLIVVAIGFTGGVVFMYVQCKMYLTLCKKWRMYNKVIIISSISEAQREKANHEGMVRLSEKQAQLGNGPLTNLELFNVVNETESV